MQPEGAGIGGEALFSMAFRTRCCLELNRIDPTEIIADPNWTVTGSPYSEKMPQHDG
jgi:hypothetical protein